MWANFLLSEFTFPCWKSNPVPLDNQVGVAAFRPTYDNNICIQSEKSAGPNADLIVHLIQTSRALHSVLGAVHLALSTARPRLSGRSQVSTTTSTSTIRQWNRSASDERSGEWSQSAVCKQQHFELSCQSDPMHRCFLFLGSTYLTTMIQ